MILTLQLESEAQRYFSKLREVLFPPHLNVVPAHITLFHSLPELQLESISEELIRTTRDVERFPVTVTGLRHLGRGVAFTLESPTLKIVREHLASEWQAWLSPQDRQPFKPHVTVQNKVSPEEAGLTHFRLKTHFQSHTVEATGLDLWQYLNGPWKHEQSFPFQEPDTLRFD